jgi:hypothetical protein
MIDSFTQQFTKQPESVVGVSVVVCSHAQHGIYQFYIPDEDFLQQIRAVIRGAWVNGFVVVIYPATL